MISEKTKKPYCPPNRQALREDAQAAVLEFARGALFAWDDVKSDMTKEEYRLRVRYAYLEFRRVAKVLGFDPAYYPVPALKDIPY